MEMPRNLPFMHKIVLGIKCGVPAWLASGLEELCARRESLRDSEIDIIGYQRANAVGRVREWLATGGAAGFPRSGAQVRYCMDQEPGLWELKHQIRMNAPVQTCGMKRHNSFYMNDWDLLTFKVRILSVCRPARAEGKTLLQVENTLYRVPTNLLLQSTFFQSMLEDPRIGGRGEGQSEDQPINLAISEVEMDSFLAVLNSR